MINKLVFAGVFMIMFSCSTNFGRLELMREFESRKTRMLQSESNKTVSLNGSVYILPAQFKVTLSNSSTIQGEIIKFSTGSRGEEYLVKSDDGTFFGKLYKTDITVLKILSAPIGGVDDMPIDIYFSPTEVSKEFKIISVYHWKFLSFPPFLTTTMMLNRKSVLKHWLNASQLNGDAVIIEPSLTHSTVIKYED